MSEITKNMTEQESRKDRFRILVSIDGSEESYQSLRYAAKMGKGVDADIVLLYVRPIDQGLRSGGLQVRVARENMLDWGLELPGIKYLKKGYDIDLLYKDNVRKAGKLIANKLGKNCTNQKVLQEESFMIQIMEILR